MGCGWAAAAPSSRSTARRWAGRHGCALPAGAAPPQRSWARGGQRAPTELPCLLCCAASWSRPPHPLRSPRPARIPLLCPSLFSRAGSGVLHILEQQKKEKTGSSIHCEEEILSPDPAHATHPPPLPLPRLPLPPSLPPQDSAYGGDPQWRSNDVVQEYDGRIYLSLPPSCTLVLVQQPAE